MIFSLLEKLQQDAKLVLVTVLRTEGHTYKKAGAKALFVVGSAFPVYGNLGSLCADQEIVRAASKAHAEGRPCTVSIDTRDSKDIELGYGTYCGGMMELLVEPILDQHRSFYEQVLRTLRGRESVQLAHDLKTGRLSVTDGEPKEDAAVFQETLQPPERLVIVGATPLARCIVDVAAEMDFDIHINDWREAYLDAMRPVADVTIRGGEPDLRGGDHVLIVSHSFAHDIDALEQAIRVGCGYVGLLSSRKRRDHMFQELQRRGIGAGDLQRVFSPAGIDIGARSDKEIAVSILGELVRYRRK